MQVTVDFWVLLASIASLIATLGGVLLKLGHVLLGRFLQQFELRLQERFQAQNEVVKKAEQHFEHRFNSLERGLKDVEAENRQIQTEVLRNYTRREDSIRDQTVLHAKLDAINTRMELLAQLVAKLKGAQDR